MVTPLACSRRFTRARPERRDSVATSCSCRFHIGDVVAILPFRMIEAEHVQHAVHDEARQLFAQRHAMCLGVSSRDVRRDVDVADRPASSARVDASRTR